MSKQVVIPEGTSAPLAPYVPATKAEQYCVCLRHIGF